MDQANVGKEEPVAWWLLLLGDHRANTISYQTGSRWESQAIEQAFQGVMDQLKAVQS